MIVVPSLLDRALSADTRLEGAVKLSLCDFEPAIRGSQMPLFPNYTDHGIDHIQGIMRTAAGLIRDTAWEVVTPQDAGVLVLASLLHDLGMHLTKEGFINLAEGKEHWDIVPKLGDLPWPELWQGYVTEARRFDERTLQRLFDKPESVPIPELRRDADWSENQFKLVGEFVRRHHHRLAHQIALNGMPGVKAKRIRIAELDADLLDIAGLVARSHGMNLRETFGYLGKKYGLQEYGNLHAVFLMALVRAADYMQLQADRAPKEVLAIRELRSPISRLEWKMHQAVKSMQPGQDREAVHLVFDASDVQTYFRIRDLLRGLQAELDLSWAVLGEVYSRFDEHGMNRLGLTLRRVTSNLDFEEGFAEDAEYLPRRAIFDTAGPDLLKLLMEPLYGNDPAIGVRELMQNAVDAVRELEATQPSAKSKQVGGTRKQPDVLITLREDDDGKFRLIVRDLGIGMTADVIINYFLKAGATLRKSPAWRQTFEDEWGHSRVLRSGRFGIGVFAAFLLGSRLDVITRHFSEKRGISFTASIDDELVELRKTDCPVGTTVSVLLDEDTAKRLLDDEYAWDWYALDKPSVVRKIELTYASSLSRQKKDSSRLRSRRGILLEQRHRIPQSQPAPLPEGTRWHRISVPGYHDIQWSYISSERVLLYCNGIVVTKSQGGSLSGGWNRPMPSFRDMRVWNGYSWDLRVPDVSCFDPDGLLPLDLQRRGLTRPYPFVKELQQAVFDDLIAFLLTNVPPEPPKKLGHTGFDVYFKHPAIRMNWGRAQLGPIALMPDGFTLAAPGLIRSLPGMRGGGFLWMPFLRDITRSEVELGPLTAHPLLAFQFSWREADLDDIMQQLYHFGLSRFRVVIPAEARESITWPGNGVFGETKLEDRPEFSLAWCNERGGNPDSLVNLAAALHSRAQGLGEIVIIGEWYLTGENGVELTPLEQRWMDLFGTVRLPFDPAERRARFPKAHEILAEYLEHWEEERNKKQQERLDRDHDEE